MTQLFVPNDKSDDDFTSLDIVGIDEVGYGCWAGPVYVCALQLNKLHEEIGCKFVDSKSINHKKRVEFYNIIKQVATWQIGIGLVEEINEFGLAYAYRKAIERAIEPFLKCRLIIDGRKPKWLDERGLNCVAIVKGDCKVPAISAASIVAKVERDAIMVQLAKQHPEYLFEENKGYGTSAHIAAIREHGFCIQHRTSYDLKKYTQK